MNQITAPDSEQNETIPPSVTTGQRLREAREALDLTREDVARELRLQEKLIEALESGDRSKLPPSAFISGYLRSYARLLNLPAEQLIAEYLAEPVSPSVYRATNRTGMKITTSSDPKIKLMTFVVAAVTVALFAAWWANERYSLISLEPAHESDTAVEEHQALDANLPAPSPLYQDPPEEVAPETGADVKRPAGTSTLPTTKTVPPANGTPAATVAPATSPAAPSATATAQPVEAAKPAPTSPVTTQALAASVPQSTLVLEFQAASWTEIKDAKGRVLVYDTINPGRKMQLQGVAPFNVFLGYAPGVLIYYNGTLFPHGDYHRGDLARFTVGSSQDNRPLVR